MGDNLISRDELIAVFQDIIQNSVNNPKAIELEKYCDEYLSLIWRNGSENYYRSVNLFIKLLLMHFPGKMLVTAIGVNEWQKYFDKLSETASRGVWVYYRTGKAMMNRAVELGYLRDNPILKVKLKKQQVIERGYLNEEELNRVLEIFQQWSMKTGCKKSKRKSMMLIYDIVKTGFYSGMRISELMNIKCKNVNIHKRLITVGDDKFTTKSKKSRVIPISDKIIDIFTKRMSEINSEDGYVFGLSREKTLTKDYISKTFKSAARKVGLDENICFHSTRHSFGSYLIQNNVNIYHIKELMGHSSVTVTERYSHNNLDTLKEAIKKFN